MNILYYRYFQPFSHVHYYEDSLKRAHNVYTYGKALTQTDAIKFSMQDLMHETYKTDIEFFTFNFAQVLDFLAKNSISIDIFFYTDILSFPHIEGLFEMQCPTICFILDPQVISDFKFALSQLFDYVFITQKSYLDDFKYCGHTNIHWLTHACDINIHRKINLPKIYDIGFVGNIVDYRQRLLEKLSQRFKVFYDRVYGKKMTEIFSSSKAVVNFLSYGEINMRIFEAMASGSLLLTPYAPQSAIEEIFCHKKHLIYYKNTSDLFELAEYYLKNTDEREIIAQTGMNEVMQKHTYDHRVNQMLNILTTHKPQKRDNEKYDYFLNIYNGYVSVISHSLDNATKLALKALSIMPQLPFAYNLLGVIYRKQGNFQKAIKSIHKALQINPSYYEAYLNLTVTLKSAGYDIEAQEIFKIIQQLKGADHLRHEFL